ncbi:hypothetical protein ONZ51_g11971 [Trametes cubensis]|uniref:DUF6534 domain-containing protein n=1 Tax=Trametes cubensis TaxID=1111947 RepID=A0AAD7TGR0_9APHY|nr:hypothetical protein ONZ51_g11971 [Trametes cubensis]
MPLLPRNDTVDLVYTSVTDVPSLSTWLGAFLLATFICLMLYGLTLHQSYRYSRLFPEDIILLKAIVLLTVVAETVHIALCMHICYFYLVTNYFNAVALLEGVWSFRILPIMTATIIALSQGYEHITWKESNFMTYNHPCSFFARRVYLLGGRYRIIVAVILVPMFNSAGPHAYRRWWVLSSGSQRIEGHAEFVQDLLFIFETFAKFQKHAWLTSAGFTAALLIDILLSGTLIITLHRSRTGFKGTDSLIDVLIIYNINTGKSPNTPSRNSYSLAHSCMIRASHRALVAPDNLLYVAFNIIATDCYANSLLAVLNSRHTLANKVQGDCFTSATLGRPMLPRTVDTQCNAIEMWNVPQSQLPNSAGADVSSTVVDIKIQPDRDVPIVIQGDEDSVRSEGMESK